MSHKSQNYKIYRNICCSRSCRGKHSVKERFGRNLYCLMTNKRNKCIKKFKNR